MTNAFDFGSYHSYSLPINNTYAMCHRVIQWGRDEIAAISQTIFSNACSWMKLYEILIKILLKFVSTVQFDIF